MPKTVIDSPFRSNRKPSKAIPDSELLIIVVDRFPQARHKEQNAWVSGKYGKLQ